MRRQLLLWDIDGTLMLTNGAGARALANYFMDRYGWSDVKRAIRPHGMTDPAIVEGIFRYFGHAATEQETSQVLRDYVSLLSQEEFLLEEATIMPGVPKVLEGPSTVPYVNALLTGNVASAAELKLRAIGLWNYFDFGAFGDDAAFRPDLVPVAWERATHCLHHSFAPEDTWIIGDTPLDLEAGRAHGVNVILVGTNPGVQWEALERSEPELLMKNLSDYSMFWDKISARASC